MAKAGRHLLLCLIIGLVGVPLGTASADARPKAASAKHHFKRHKHHLRSGHDSVHQAHRRHRVKKGRRRGAGSITPPPPRSGLRLTPPNIATPQGPLPVQVPSRRERPALITPGAPPYPPGILVPGPPGTVPQCAPLSRQQGLC